jgi:hypothetical protein
MYGNGRARQADNNQRNFDSRFALSHPCFGYPTDGPGIRNDKVGNEHAECRRATALTFRTATHHWSRFQKLTVNDISEKSSLLSYRDRRGSGIFRSMLGQPWRPRHPHSETRQPPLRSFHRVGNFDHDFPFEVLDSRCFNLPPKPSEINDPRANSNVFCHRGDDVCLYLGSVSI